MESTTPQRLQLMCLAQANQPLLRQFAENGRDVRSAFDTVIDLFTDDSTTAEDRLYLRMVFDTVSAALLAAQRTGAGPEDVIATAKRASIALSRSRSTH